MTSKIFCAIDTQDIGKAQKTVRDLSSLPLHFKLGLEFFTAQGLAGVDILRKDAGAQSDIFLDLKFHDIPNTVAGAVRAVLGVQPQFLTVHAGGGQAMMEAAVEAAQSSAAPPKILAVTVLTSMSQQDLVNAGQSSVAERALALALLAQDCGASGAVCSPHEIELLRRNIRKDFLLVVPGIRPAGAGQDDQKRTMTPAEALALGADYLVIGRPITAAASPVDAARNILSDLRLKAA